MRLIDADALNLNDLPAVQPKTEGFEWCHDCKEYDQEGHCCHRWTKVIRKTVDEIKADPVRHGHWIQADEDFRHQVFWWNCSECGFSVSSKYNYCPDCGARMDEK